MTFCTARNDSSEQWLIRTAGRPRHDEMHRTRWCASADEWPGRGARPMVGSPGRHQLAEEIGAARGYPRCWPKAPRQTRTWIAGRETRLQRPRERAGAGATASGRGRDSKRASERRARARQRGERCCGDSETQMRRQRRVSRPGHEAGGLGRGRLDEAPETRSKAAYTSTRKYVLVLVLVGALCTAERRRWRRLVDDQGCNLTDCGVVGSPTACVHGSPGLKGYRRVGRRSHVAGPAGRSQDAARFTSDDGQAAL